MVDFETIPNNERVNFLKAIAEQVHKYYSDPANAEKYETHKKENKKCVA